MKMKNILILSLFILTLISCKKDDAGDVIEKTNWIQRKVEFVDNDLFQGKTYLPIYSHIYHLHEHKTFDLTITVSIRNISKTDSIYILKADYYNTSGENIRKYLKNPIYLKPMETVEIIIEEQDNSGGSGANFLFDWAMKNDKNPPLFEAVMISTSGQQGLSFITRGLQVFD
jgi:hypothetical protein